MSAGGQNTTLREINRLLGELTQAGGAAGTSGGGAATAATGSAVSGHADYTPRERLQAMMLRAYIDEDYATKLKADPAAALRQIGFSDADARDLTQKPRGPEALTRGSCMDTTCIVSLCPSSCVASVPAIPGVCTDSASSNPITHAATGILTSIFGGF